MLNMVKTVRLDGMGNSIEEWHEGTLAEIVAAVNADHPNSLIEARYVR